MGTKEKIGKLEALLDRIRVRAAEPRHVDVAPAPAAPAIEVAPIVVAPVAIVAAVTAPPPAEVATALRETTEPPAPATIEEAPPPLESRARLVAAEERSPHDEVLELDDRHVVTDDAEVSVSVAEADIGEAELLGEEAPPSSKRPIVEPAPIEPPAPPKTPPPESGKQVAALSFDDDFTGVREAANKAAPPIEADLEAAPIPLASQRPAHAPVKDEMEADLPTGVQPAPGLYTPDLAPPSAKPPSKPPSVRLPSERPAPALAMEPEVVVPKLAEAKPATFEGAVAAFKPTTFAELLDASLGL